MSDPVDGGLDSGRVNSFDAPGVTNPRGTRPLTVLTVDQGLSRGQAAGCSPTCSSSRLTVPYSPR